MELCKRLNHVESMHVYYSSVDSQLWANCVHVKATKQVQYNSQKYNFYILPKGPCSQAQQMLLNENHTYRSEV